MVEERKINHIHHIIDSFSVNYTLDYHEKDKKYTITLLKTPLYITEIEVPAYMEDFKVYYLVDDKKEYLGTSFRQRYNFIFLDENKVKVMQRIHNRVTNMWPSDWISGCELLIEFQSTNVIEYIMAASIAEKTNRKNRVLFDNMTHSADTKTTYIKINFRNRNTLTYDSGMISKAPMFRFEKQIIQKLQY